MMCERKKNPKSTMAIVICCLGLLAICKFDVSAANLRVSTTGNDSNNCLSPATACLTIQAAVNKAADGDSIFIAAGTYAGLVGITQRKNLTFQGDLLGVTRIIPPSVV